MNIAEIQNKIEKQANKNYEKQKEVCSQIIRLLEESGLSYGEVRRIIAKVETEMTVAAEYAAKSMDFTAIRKLILKNDESVVVHNLERDFSFSEESDPVTAEKLLWAFEKDEKTENIAIVLMNGEQIVIHGKKEAEMFCNILTGYFQ